MKIGQLDNSPKANTPAATARNGEAKAAAPAAPEASAKVELSSAAALAAQGSSADFDAEKVARIAQAIREGTFQIDAEAIADKLLAHTRDLVGPRSH